MGGSVAKCLIDAGFDVVGFDISEEACDAFDEYGGEIAPSNAAVAADADIVLTGLSYPESSRRCIGVTTASLRNSRGLVCIEQSTIPLEPTRQLADELDAHGVELLGPPFLSEDPQFARNGTMVLPIGGEEALYDDDNIWSILEVMTQETH